MISRMTLFVAAVSTLGAAVFLCMPDAPLGISGEWIWNRIPLLDSDRSATYLAISIVGLFAIAYLAFVWYGSLRIAACGRISRAIWLVLLVACGCLWMWRVQAQPPTDHRLVKFAWVPYYQKFAGYYHIARFEIDDPREFLRTYEKRMSEGDVLHIGTHPPGLILYHYGLLEVCRRRPALTSTLLKTQPAIIRETFTTTERNQGSYGIQLRREDRAAIWLGVLLFQLATAITVVPLYGLLRQFYDARASWLGAALWPLIPAPIVFLPKSDSVLPLLATSFLLAWLIALRKRSLLASACAGVILFVGMLMSLAVLPIALIAFLLLAWEFAAPGETERRRHRGWLVAVVCAGAVVFMLGVLLFWSQGHVCLFRVWSWNLSNHASFYGTYHRSYWKWLLVNPLELSLAVGPAIAVMGLATVLRFLRTPFQNTQRTGRFVTVFLLTLGALWISGKNSGEAARLWILFHPLIVMLAAACFATRCGDVPEKASSEGAQPDNGIRSHLHEGRLLAMLSLQAAYCVVVVTKIDGFDIYTGLNV